MATSDGPISQGIRDAISTAMARGMTAYKIAAEAGLAPSQLYRFLAKAPDKRRGLSLEALDGIAKALDLEFGPKRDGDKMVDATMTQPQTVPLPFVAPMVAGLINNVAGPVVAPTALDQPASRDDDPAGTSSRPYVTRKEKKRLEAAKWPSYYHIKLDGLGHPEREINVSAFEDLWQGGVEFAVGAFGSAGIKELWAAHSRLTQNVDDARIAFWEFVSNVARNNPTLLSVFNLAELFGDLKILIDDPDDLGRIAGSLKTEDADLSLREDATNFIARAEQICKDLDIEMAIDYDWNLSVEEKMRKWEQERKERNFVFDRMGRRPVVDKIDGHDVPTPSPKLSESPPMTLEDSWAEKEKELSERTPMFSIKSFVRRGEYSKEEIDELLEETENPEIHRLAKRYLKPGRMAVERAKYFCFFSHVLHVNPHGATILGRGDIYGKYLEVAKRIYDHGHMKIVANQIEPGDLDQEGEALTERLKHYLERKGIYDGIHSSYMPKFTPPPGSVRKLLRDFGSGGTRSYKPKP